MKQLLNHLTFCALLLALTPLTAQRFSFTPEKPQPGQKITIHYNSTGSDLAGLTDIEATAYLFEGGQPIAAELPLQFDGKDFIGQFSTKATTKAVLFSLKATEGDKEDNNDSKGYKLLCYQANSELPVAGAYAEKANIIANYAWLGGVKRDFEKALSLMDKEFENHPTSLQNKDYLLHYARLSKRQNDEASMATILAQIELLTTNPKAAEADLVLAKNLLAAIGNKEQETEIAERLKSQYPAGEINKIALIESFNQKQELAERTAIFEKLKNNFKADSELENTLNGFAAALATAYGKEGNWGMYDKYVSYISDRSRQAGVLNNQAWGLSGESLDGEAKDAMRGKEMSARSLKLLSEEMENPAKRPSYLTTSQFKKNLKGNYAMYADTYALLAYKSGNTAEALKYQQIACEADHFESGELNERYAAYFEKENGSQETEAMLSKLIAEGKATSAMKEQHKRLFMENNTLESAYDKYRKSLEQEALNKKKEELREKVLDLPAPLFKLTNLQGKDVSLESLKGKVVVLDFWATWCGPCKASFPGMQRAVNKYAENKEVEFLFIDTWEKVKMEEKAKNAADFIASKEYTFQVLLDNDNVVIGQYGVEGIPTKFVVDKNGIIRFKSVGFSGNDDDLVTELSMMIEMAGAGSTVATLTGAP